MRSSPQFAELVLKLPRAEFNRVARDCEHPDCLWVLVLFAYNLESRRLMMCDLKGRKAAFSKGMQATPSRMKELTHD